MGHKKNIGFPCEQTNIYFVRPRIYTRTSTSAQNARPYYHQAIILHTQHDVSNKFGFPNTHTYTHPRRQGDNICVNDRWAVCECVCVCVCASAHLTLCFVTPFTDNILLSLSRSLSFSRYLPPMVIIDTRHFFLFPSLIRI